VGGARQRQTTEYLSRVLDQWKSKIPDVSGTGTSWMNPNYYPDIEIFNEIAPLIKWDGDSPLMQ
jgi:hypothetical protein